MAGTANIVEPDACLRIAREMGEYIVKNDIPHVSDLIGTLELY
jgi:hypothetical protein